MHTVYLGQPVFWLEQSATYDRDHRLPWEIRTGHILAWDSTTVAVTAVWFGVQSVSYLERARMYESAERAEEERRKCEEEG